MLTCRDIREADAVAHARNVAKLQTMANPRSGRIVRESELARYMASRTYRRARIREARSNLIWAVGIAVAMWCGLALLIMAVL